MVDRRKDRKQGAGSRGRPLTMVHHLGEIDGRTGTVVRYRRLVEQLVEDLGGDPSAAQLELARRASGAAVLATQLEAKFLADDPTVDLERYVQIIHAQCRCLVALGLRRRARLVNGPLT